MAYTENEIYYPYDYDASADVPEDMKTMAESIDEVVGEIKGTQTTQNTRLSALETGQTSQSTSIQALQSENTKLKKNQIYGTATGTEIEITDSAEMGASIGVSGESEQETRSGKNILPNEVETQIVNGVTITKKDDGSITLNGTSTAWTNLPICANEAVTLKNGDNYTSSIKTTGSKGILYFTVYNVNASLIPITMPSNTEISNKTYSPTEDVNVTRANLEWASGVTFTNCNVKIQLEEGSVATDYEQYGTMPSPEYPSEIKNLTGDTMCKIRNKNWFNNDVTYYKTNNTAELEKINTGIRAKVLTGGYNFISGYILLDYEKMVGKEFTLSATIKPSGNNNGRVMLYWYCDNTLLSYIPQMLDNTGNITFTMPDEAPETANQLRLTFYANRNGTAVTGDYVDYINVQLERGSTASPYVLYQEKSITFPFGEQKLAKGDYLASDGIHNIKNQNAINISGIVTLSNGNIGGAYYPTNKIYERNNYLLCSKAIFDKNVSYKEGTVYENYSNIVFVGNADDTLESLKNKYDGSIVEYELAEPTVTPYTQAQQEAYDKLQNLILFEGYNHIEMISPNGVKANLTVNYTKSTGMTIKSLDERIQNLENLALEV